MIKAYYMYTNSIMHVIFIVAFYLARHFLLLWLLVVILVAEDAFGIRWKSPMPRAPENTHP